VRIVDLMRLYSTSINGTDGATRRLNIKLIAVALKHNLSKIGDFYHIEVIFIGGRDANAAQPGDVEGTLVRQENRRQMLPTPQERQETI
jgi:hypothetical protein